MHEFNDAHSSQTHSLFKKIVGLTVFLTLISALTVSVWLYIYAATPAPGGGEPHRVLIPRGASFHQISTLLAEKELIKADIRFLILARVFGLSGAIQAGEFDVKSGQKPLDLLRQLENARPIQHRLTIAEGLRATEIGTILEESGWCSQREFLALVQDQTFIAALGFDSLDNLEGYLYPDTYYLTRIPAPECRELVRMMTRRFTEVWEKLPAHSDDRHATVILASIVEKETADPSERPRIASVFVNRLAKGMKLQSDPTVIYGIEGFDGNITKADLRRPTPYNTYAISGLPKGPISNPGKEALLAVLQPSEEDYFYFVSRNDGTHYFSKTLKEHNRAVRKYQKKGNN